MKRLVFFLLTFIITAVSVPARTIPLKAGIPIEKQVIYPNSTYVVSTIIDCEGKDIVIPEGCILRINSGGICNGSLIGNNTKLKVRCKNGIAFIVKGTWLAPTIDDRFFDSSLLTDDQIIGNINNLQSDAIKNVIKIGAKDYNCSITKLGGAVLILRSNTKCMLSSTISLLPCSFPNYQIVQIYDVNDVEFRGGIIIGDLLDHPFTSDSSHEWGHGISIKNASRVRVSSVVITHCIGDGVVVGGWQEPNTNVFNKAAKQVRLENITSDDNRRQGLTIGHVDGLVVKRSRFINTGQTKYTAPSSGIDIEPDAGAPWNHGTRNVLIEKCFASGNKYRQFLCHGFVNRDGEDNIQNILIRDCVFEGNCDIHTDGVRFVSSTMESATFQGGRDLIDKVVFDECSFRGPTPIVLQGTHYRDEKGLMKGGNFGSIILTKCKIGSGASSSPLFSSSYSEIGKIEHVILDRCTMILSSGGHDNQKIATGKFESIIQENRTKKVVR